MIRIARSLICSALLVPLAVTGCNSGPGPIAIGDPSPSPPDGAPEQIHSDITIPASASTTAATGISRWVLHALPDGGQEIQGIAGNSMRFQIDEPRFTSRTAGSMAISVFDDTGRRTEGELTVIDGATVSNGVPPGAGDFAQRFGADLASAPVAQDWNDCNNARNADASAQAAVVAAQAAVAAAAVAVTLACFTPAVVIVADCVAAGAAATAAAATLASANATAAQTSSAVHTACDNLCTDDSWCTGRYGAGWTCGGDGTCTQVTSTVCYACQTVTCGWDFTCVTQANPAPFWCGACGGGGGGDDDGGGDQCGEDCNQACGGAGWCSDGTCQCGM